MEFSVKPLPYAKDALAPAMSAETLEFHYEKHHKGYMTKLAAALKETPQAEASLEQVIRGSEGGVFNNAAQVWNHTFFWESMQPQGGGEPSGAVKDLLVRDFGSLEAFREKFVSEGGARFGSGYVWLTLDAGKARIVTTANAECPLTGSATPLLTADVWEHAYYIDHRNDRAAFLKVFLDKLVSWDSVAQRLAQA